MPVLDQLAKRATDLLPSVISPRAHAVADYATAAAFLVFGITSWRRDKRAAVGSLGCGLFEIVTTVLTDYPGGVARHLSFRSHGRMDIGLAAMVGTMPDYLGLKDVRATRFFRMQAVALASVTGLTDFTGTGESRQLRHLEKAA